MSLVAYLYGTEKRLPTNNWLKYAKEYLPADPSNYKMLNNLPNAISNGQVDREEMIHLHAIMAGRVAPIKTGALKAKHVNEIVLQEIEWYNDKEKIANEFNKRGILLDERIKWSHYNLSMYADITANMVRKRLRDLGLENRNDAAA